MSGSPAPAAFRADIQILRGIAVLAVLVFHLFPKAIPGGFLGVDVFFVVSGFLMAYLYGDMAGVGARFYWLKRARRILPAYFATIIATLLVGCFVILPHQLADTARAAIFAAALIPNIGYFLDTSYFDVSNFRPLLHLWSLGVEAQFYLVFPLFAWLWRKSPVLLLVLALAAFLVCLAPISPAGPFFLTPFRMWEFTIGFAAARVGLRLGTGLGWIGSVCLAALIGLFFVSVPEAGHPGLAALAACLLTGAILMIGLPDAVCGNPAARGLVLVGKYSYSLYLVHYPVIALMLYRPFHGNQFPTPDPLQALLILGLIALLTFALYHFVESPSRQRRAGDFASRMVAAASGIVVLGLAAPVAAATFYRPAERAIFAAWTDRGQYRCGKVARLMNPGARTCALSAGRRTVLLVGDSHADAIKSAVVEAAKNHDIGVAMMVDNCALGQAPCNLSLVVAEARRLRADAVIVHAAGGNFDSKAVVDLGRTLPVLAIGPTPAYQRSVPLSLFADDPERQNAGDVATRYAPIRTGLAPLKDMGSKVIDPTPIFCQPECRLVDAEGRPYYFDSNHLTLTGARLLVPALTAALRP